MGHLDKRPDSYIILWSVLDFSGTKKKDENKNLSLFWYKPKVCISPLGLPTAHSFKISLPTHHVYNKAYICRMRERGEREEEREREMASQDSSNGLTSTPKDGGVVSPRGHQCLCSPTTHQGSFRCKFHRSNSQKPFFSRSKSMPEDGGAPPAQVVSPKSPPFK